MTLKKKLTLGLGFLFLIIFGLVIFYSYDIGKLSSEAGNILKDNYNSLVYSKNMASALEGTRTAITSIVFNPSDDQKASDYYLKLLDAGKTEFETNLKAQKGNITEIHEGEYVAAVDRSYELYASLCLRMVKGERSAAMYFGEFQPAFENLRHAINSINDINMQAVERKSRMTKQDSARIIKLMAGVGTLCLFLAFGYFWYFPFYVSHSISYLSEMMRMLLKKYGIRLDIKTDDETFIILQGINLLESSLGIKDKTKGSKSED